MRIFKKIIAQYKYKKAINRIGKQLVSCVELYNRNENRIKEIEMLIKEDKNISNLSCKTMTNREKIQAMSTKELAFLLSYFSTCDHCIYIEVECARKANHEIHCEEGIAAWLEQEAKN